MAGSDLTLSVKDFIAKFLKQKTVEIDGVKYIKEWPSVSIDHGHCNPMDLLPRLKKIDD